MNTEYKVVPAPSKGLKSKGVKSGADRFANALQTTINLLAQDGWEYLRAETLPSEEREGLMGKTTVYQNVLVFKRPTPEEEAVIEDTAPAEDHEEVAEEEPVSDEVAVEETDAVEEAEKAPE